MTLVELFELALLHHRSGQAGQAEPLYRQILQADPDNGAAYMNLGVTLQTSGRAHEALACFRAAARLSPFQADTHNNLGIALKDQGHLSEATDCFRAALDLNPNHVHALHNLGVVLAAQNQLTDAAECFRHALRGEPRYASAHNDLGSVLAQQGQFAESMACFRAAVRSDPRHVDAQVNLGTALKEQGQFAEAAECYRQALVLHPGHAMALWNRSLLRLVQGDFEGGWPDYEQRWAKPGKTPRVFREPRWDGAPLAGKTILVYAEQGLGDTIQFARYLRLVKGTVIFECQPSLAPLFENLPGIDILVQRGEPLPPFDVQVPLLSLPGIFHTTLADIPADIPYLHAQPDLIEHWRALKPERTGSTNVGIVWQGSMNQPGDRRSLPLIHFEALARVTGVRLVSLQVGPGTTQLATAPFAVTDLGSQFNGSSLADLAAAIMTMDLVVTVDTAAAHLAGALGVPVWLLLSAGADWRWLLERADSPWYPTMRLFRQSKAGEWDDVFARAAMELRKGERSEERGVRRQE